MNLIKYVLAHSSCFLINLMEIKLKEIGIKANIKQWISLLTKLAFGIVRRENSKEFIVETTSNKLHIEKEKATLFFIRSPLNIIT